MDCLPTNGSPNLGKSTPGGGLFVFLAWLLTYTPGRISTRDLTHHHILMGCESAIRPEAHWPGRGTYYSMDPTLIFFLGELCL